MTAFDALILFIVSLSTLRGLARGFSRSVITTAATIAGVFVAAHFYRGVLPLVHPWVESDVLAQLLAFLGIYLLTLGCGIVLARAIHSGLHTARLSWLDHLAGGAFGLLRGWVFCSILYLALNVFPWRPNLLEQSRTSSYLIRGAAWISRVVSHHMPRFSPESPERPTPPRPTRS